MKKNYVIVLLFLIVVDIPALEFTSAISMGEVGVDTNFRATAIYAHLFNFNVQEKKGFGIQLTPVRALLDIETIGFTAVTFVNAMLYYDFLKTKGEIQLGPFVSLNTVNVLKMDSVECHTGLLFSLRTLGYEYGTSTTASIEWLTVRTGYKYLDGANNFYAQVGLDMLTMLSVLATFQGEKNKELIKDNNRRR
jgi:hypothetical protein